MNGEESMPNGNYVNRLDRLEAHAAGGRLSPMLVVECRADADQQAIDATIAAARRARGDPEDSVGLVVVINRFSGDA